MKKTTRPKIEKEGFTTSGLPTKEVLNDTVERVTPAAKKDTVRSTGISQDGRKRFSTMLKPGLKKKLGMEAVERQSTLAEVLEQILLERYNTQ